MGQEEPEVAGGAPAVEPPGGKTREQVKESLRPAVRKAGSAVAGAIFDDPDFQNKMNNWMLGTHVLWGISLAFTFIAVNEALIWLQPPPWLIVATFGPIGVGYNLSQWFKYRRKRAPGPQSR